MERRDFKRVLEGFTAEIPHCSTAAIQKAPRRRSVKCVQAAGVKQTHCNNVQQVTALPADSGAIGATRAPQGDTRMAQK